MIEIMSVAEASGYKMETAMRVTAADWERLAEGSAPEIDKVITANGAMFPPDQKTGTALDIERNRPIELDYTNGYVVKKGKELNVPTPTNEIMIKMVKEIQIGKRKPGLANLDEIMKLIK